MSAKRGYAAADRAAAINLVAQLRAAAPNRRNGAIVTAARRLGIRPNALGKWCREHDLTHAATPAPQPSPGRRDVAALARLLTCGLCGLHMTYQLTTAGTPIYQCTTACTRRRPIPAAVINRVIGQMILHHVIPWTHRAHNQMTAETAAWQASRVINRIVVGVRPTDLGVRWRSMPVWPSSIGAHTPPHRSAPMPCPTTPTGNPRPAPSNVGIADPGQTSNGGLP